MEETAQIEEELKQRIHQSVKEAGHDVETVSATTSETPLSFSKEDVENAVGDVVEDIFTGGPKSRETPSKNFLQKKWELLTKKKNQDEEVKWK